MNYLTFPIGYEDENNNFILISKFKLRIDLLLEVYEQEIEFNKKICPTLPPDAPRHKEFNEITRLSEQLKNCVNQKIDIEFENADYIEVFSSQIIFNKEFESVYCAQCNTEYKPKEITVESWSTGESLFAEGGRQIKCTKGHLLYKMMEWNS